MNFSSITGGPQGRTFPVPTFGDFAFNQQNNLFGIAVTASQQYFLLIPFILVIAALFVGNVMRSRAGRAFRAVRDHEVGAAIMGVNLFEAKMGAFISLLIPGRNSRCALCLLYQLRHTGVLGPDARYPVCRGYHCRRHRQCLGFAAGRGICLWTTTGN